MRKIISFFTISGLIATVSLGLETITKCSQEEFTVSGRVESIENCTLNLREPNGEIFNVAAKSDKLEGIEVGDQVVVHDAGGGGEVFIKKIGKAETKQKTQLKTITPTEGIITGEITLLGERMLNVKEDNTQIEYEFTASPDKLRNISTGYRVEVKAIDGKVLSIISLGLPMRAESEFYQKWKVIEKPQG
jgi:hypothetical protein